MMKFNIKFSLLFFCFSVCYSVLAQEINYERKALGKITHPKLGEISGIIPSVKYPHCFWVHNDSGDDAVIYLIDTLSNLMCQFKLENIEAVDMEDIAWLTIENKPYLLLADIGNNRRDREILSFYLFEEPDFSGSQTVSTIAKSSIKEIEIRYSDKRRDAEAIFVDPLDNRVYIISKRDLRVNVFDFKIPALTDHILTLETRLTLPYTFVTAADISRDGRYILIKTLTHVYQWSRNSGVSILETLRTSPQVIPYQAEPQGEAISFDVNNCDFYTISERPFGLDSYLYKYKKK
ncbi:hypothetical protein FAZ19_19495 [Sphingobacterium alkalisoli]|uniref:PE-PGRS family protein n=1 Tax=Sphingobacterium alkalisoli TaxID=1874115 RepID=A0A4U0GUK8_9SPHI|nr:hypothetical protein [Sphingobacterium alkalisoli]TJY62658.1 hypothetical protein FAZ19_19495 [Sphingobacterium alkalisoli]GGH28038.1 hypothetical protein GCM10011418_38400 [Sphingobacterium alkalisoli]